MRKIAMAVVASALVACGGARRGEPTSAATLLSAEAGHGEVMFARACHECHPQGEAGLGPAINDKPLPSILIRTQIRRGMGAMPAFPESKLSDRDVDAIIAYLKALRSRPAR